MTSGSKDQLHSVLSAKTYYKKKWLWFYRLDDVWQAKSKKLTSKTQKSDEMFQQNETLITFFELSRIFETYFLQL